MRLVLVLALTLGGFAGTQTPDLAAEADRLARDILTSIPETDRAGITARLERGRAALAAGKLYLALYDLQPVYEGEAGYRLAGQAAQFTTHEAFKARWAEMGLPPPPGPGKAKVHFIEALAQSSEGRAAATYRASLPYAQDSGVSAGLYYLGESHAMPRFAAICRGLDVTSAGVWPSMMPVGTPLTAHESRVVKAYADAAAPLRPRYAQVSVAIKQARSLDDAGRAEGALLQYLVSRFRFALIQREGSAAPAAADVLKRVRSTAMPAGGDHSIGTFFLQLAEGLLTAGEPTPAAAAAILDDVIPAYLELVKK
jgi:hypothetical protein